MDQDSLSLLAASFNETFARSKELFPALRDWKRPAFRMDITGTTAGQAIFKDNCIRVNPTIFLRNKTDFCKSTIPHEFAHLIAGKLYRDYGHGRDWGAVMNRFGLEARRCHNYDVRDLKQSRTLNRYIYICDCSQKPHLVTEKIHNYIQKRISQRVCVTCQARIAYTGKTAQIKDGKLLKVADKV